MWCLDKGEGVWWVKVKANENVGEVGKGKRGAKLNIEHMDT